MCELPDFERIRMVRARKEHRCVECRNSIAKGETHESHAGVWAGDFCTFRTCKPCADLRDKVRPLIRRAWGEECFEFGALHRDVIPELRLWSDESRLAVDAILGRERTPP